jgi:chaperonin GroEL
MARRRTRKREGTNWTFVEQTPGVVFQPATYRRMQKGIDLMVGAIRPTLGPRPRIVAIERHTRGKAPELLDSGGVIARRVIELPDRDEDMGAMLLRSVLWRVQDQVGDGTATAAVLLQSVFSQGVHYIVSGGDAMRLRPYLERGLQVILRTLDSMVIEFEGKEKLAGVAAAVCYDLDMAKMLGEIFDIIGEYGWLDIRSGRGRGLEREYVEGSYWPGGLFSRQMINDPANLRAQLEDAAILISDLEIEEAAQLVPVFETAVEAGIRSLLIVARKLSESAMALLLANRSADNFQVAAAKAPYLRSDEQVPALEDLAVLTGGRFLMAAAGHKLSEAELQDLGRARTVWADADHFGVVGGRGDPRKLREHIAGLRAVFGRAGKPEVRKRLRQRIGKLVGGSATLWVGGATEAEIEARKELAQRTADALRGAVQEGVLPGGGVSLLACRTPLREMLEQSTDPDARAAYRILIRSLEEPTRTIIANAGYDPSDVMAEIRQAGPGYGFDVHAERVVDLAQAGVFDVATVLKAAVRSAVIGAALGLTVDVLIHRKRVPRVPVPK